MALTQHEMDRIQEEEAFRVLARMRAHERLIDAGGRCTRCGRRPGRLEAQAWAWAAALALFSCAALVLGKW